MFALHIFLIQCLFLLFICDGGQKLPSNMGHHASEEVEIVLENNKRQLQRFAAGNKCKLSGQPRVKCYTWKRGKTEAACE